MIFKNFQFLISNSQFRVPHCFIIVLFCTYSFLFSASSFVFSWLNFGIYLVGAGFSLRRKKRNLKVAATLYFCVFLLWCVTLGFSQSDTTQDTLEARPQIRAVPASASDGVEITAKLYPIGSKQLTVGDPFKMTFTVKHPKPIPISPLAVDTIDPFGIVEQKVSQKTLGDKMISTFDLKVAAFATGDLKIPPFRVFFQTNPKDTILKYVASDSIPISIASVLSEDMRDINDIKKPIDFPNLLPLIIIGILIGLGVVTFIGLRFAKRFRKIREMLKPLPPPWEEAFAAINRIPVDEWLSNNLIKRYYYTISEILKRYLERRFLFPAVEQTTTELIRTMKQNKIPERDGFGNFFTSSDMVKYAKFVPPRDEMVGVIDSVKELISKTKPIQEIQSADSEQQKSDNKV